MPYSPGNPPNSTDVATNMSYVVGELRAIARSLHVEDKLRLRVWNRAPERPRQATVVYADGTNWNPGDGEGLYLYTGAYWCKLVTLCDLLLDLDEYNASIVYPGDVLDYDEQDAAYVYLAGVADFDGGAA